MKLKTREAIFFKDDNNLDWTPSLRLGCDDIVPQSTVSFVTRCTEGRISDKEIAEWSGIMDNIPLGKILQYFMLL